MGITYRDSLTTDRDKIRLRIGDTQQDAGPRPDKRNFSDDEIKFILSEEGSVVTAAVAHCFEILQSEWSSYALLEREGDIQFSAISTSNRFGDLAELWRAKPGGSAEAEASGGLVTLKRQDAYS